MTKGVDARDTDAASVRGARVRTVLSHGEPADRSSGGRRARPILWFAALGAAFIALQASVYASWLLAGDAASVPGGPDAMPPVMRAVAMAWQFASPIGLAVFLYVVLVRGRRRNDGRLSLDGLFCLAFPLLFWQDLLLNYFSNWFTYNSALVNVGSWGHHVPGWQAPETPAFGEPILWILPCYVYAFFGTTMAGGRFMAMVQRRRPNIGRVGLTACCLAAMVAVNAVGETTVMALTGMWAYPGAIPALTVFDGRYFQYPLYEGLFWGATATAWACLRFFKDSDGHTVAERGVDRVPATERTRTVLRFLALVGATNLLMLATYNIPISLMHRGERPWPADISTRSYFVGGCDGPQCASSTKVAP